MLWRSSRHANRRLYEWCQPSAKPAQAEAGRSPRSGTSAGADVASGDDRLEATIRTFHRGPPAERFIFVYDFFMRTFQINSIITADHLSADQLSTWHASATRPDGGFLLSGPKVERPEMRETESFATESSESGAVLHMPPAPA